MEFWFQSLFNAVHLPCESRSSQFLAQDHSLNSSTVPSCVSISISESFSLDYFNIVISIVYFDLIIESSLNFNV